MRINKHIFFCLSSLLFLAGCSIKKYIPEDELLYTGASLDVDAPKVKDFKQVEEELQEVLQPEPNSKFLGMHIGLWAYYKSQKDKPGFIVRFLNKKFGQEPVYFSDVNPERTEDLIINRLENRGFFYGETSSETIRGEKFAKVKYYAKVGLPYVLNDFRLDRDSLTVEHDIRDILAESEIKEGSRFDLDALNQERVRIDESLKQRGYYNFNNDFLIFEADTNITDSLRQFDLYVRLKKNVPENSLIKYKVDKIEVYPNYSLDESSEEMDTVSLDGKEFIQGELTFKPELLNDYILIEKGENYDPTKSRLSSNRLSSIGNYKFVNLRYNELENTDSLGHLEAKFLLSPMTKRSLRSELLGVSKSNNFAGPALNLVFRNRNLFKGGENFNITGNIGYEFQVAGGDRTGLHSLELGLRADLIYPRVIFFVPVVERFSYSVPKTKISLGTEHLSRGGLYRLNSFYTSYGYFWNANQFAYHEINPINVNVVNLAKSSPEFDEILNSNPFLKRSFEQNFIVGINYTFNYNKINDQTRTHGYFLGFGLDLAGNLMSGIDNLIGDGNGKILGLEYARYGKADLDLRYHLKIDKNQTLATRLFAGVGVPIGNSSSLPYSKQYFSGGPNSVRAFRIRSIGPGSYSPPGNDINSYFDQSGDIRLEGNLEYRFPIFSYLKGALFMDSGNIWLMNENEALPGGKFSSDWWKEIAVGTGFGLRVDIQFFVIRFDFATPLRKPFLPDGERWGNTFDISSKTWRRENLIFNFAIGYPF